MPTFEIVLGWGVTGATSIAIMKFFKVDSEVTKAVENIFIILFMLVAIASFMKLLPGSFGQEAWIR